MARATTDDRAASAQPDTALVPRYEPRGIVVFLLGLCIIMAGVHFSLIFRPRDALASYPMEDDSFYAFTVADNIAQGRGVTIDGVMHTNGFQPLVVFIYGGLFRLFGGDLFEQLRLVYLFNAVLAVVGAALLYRLCRPKLGATWFGRLAGLLASLLWLATYPSYLHKMNGLETGLYFVAILVGLLYYRRLCSGARRSIGHWIPLGVILGLTVLTRIDAVFLVTAFCLVHAWRLRREIPRAIKEVVTFGATAVLVSSPWWIYNVWFFGSPMPTSGQAESMANLTLQPSVGANIRSFLFDMSNLLFPFTYVPGRRVLDPYFPGGRIGYSVAVTAVLVIVLVVVAWRRRRVRAAAGSLLGSDSSPLVWHILMLGVFYIFFFGAEHFISRYLSPLLLLGIPATAVIVGGLLEGMAGRRQRVASTALGVAGLALCGVVATFMLYYYRRNTSAFYRDQYGWVARHVGNRTCVIAAGQTGALGYFRRSVINLDGKVNCEALEALKRGEIDRYILDKDVEILIDWPEYLEDNFLRYPLVRDQFVEVARSGKFGIFQRKPGKTGPREDADP